MTLIWFIAFASALVTLLANHWALPFLLMPVGLLVWVYVLIHASQRIGWRTLLLIVSLPLALAVELFLVGNLQRCGEWLCLS